MLAPTWSEASRSKGRFGGPHTRRCIHKVAHTQGSANTRRSVGTTRVLSFKGGGVWVGPRVKRSEVKQWEVWRSTHTRRCIHKVVHTQGGAHTRRSVATAGVLLFKGGCLCWPPRGAKRAEARGGLAVHTQGGAYTRWCTQGNAHTRRYAATAGVLLFKGGGAWVAPRVERSEVKQGEVWWSTHKAVYTRWRTHKAVPTQGGVWPPQESGYLRGGIGLGPRVKRSGPKQGEVWRSTHKAVHTQGGTHTRRCKHKAVCGQCKSLVI